MGTFANIQGGKGGTYRKANEGQSKAAQAAKRRVANTPDVVRAFTKGATLSGADELDALGAKLETGVSNLGRRLVGKQPEYTAQQAYDAVLQANREADEAYQAEHPVQAAGSTILGGLMMPGGSAITKGILGSGKGILGATNLGARVARGTAAGGALGGLEGFMGGAPGERTQGAKQGATTGAVIGGGIPLAGAGVGKVAEGTKRIANRATGGATDKAIEKVAQGVENLSAKVAGRAPVQKQSSVERNAGLRLAEALKKDGLSPDQIRQVQNEWLRSGVTPQLMNVVGENTRRLFRAAGASGGAANQAAVQNVDQLAADLQGSVINRTRQLTPESRPAAQVTKDIAERRGNLATEQFAPAYETPVLLDERGLSALGDAPGKQALARARAAAVARRDAEQVQQIDKIMAALEDGMETPTVSAGAIDRARIAMGNTGRSLAEDTKTRDIAGGYFGREADLDQVLAGVPELQPARQTFKGMLGQERAVELGGDNPFSDPQAYGDELQRLMGMATPEGNPYPVSPEDIRGAAGVGLRDEIIRNVGAPAEGATGYLNKLGTGTNPGQVLGATFDDADNYRQAVQNLVQQLNDARFVSPNSGSQTAMRLEDTGLIDKLPPTSLPGLALRALDKLSKGLTMTEQERAALMELGKSTDLEGALRAIPQQRAPISQYGVVPAIAGSNQ